MKTLNQTTRPYTPSPSLVFEEVIKGHFALRRAQLLAQCDTWLREVRPVPTARLWPIRSIECFT